MNNKVTRMMAWVGRLVALATLWPLAVGHAQEGVEQREPTQSGEYAIPAVVVIAPAPGMRVERNGQLQIQFKVVGATGAYRPNYADSTYLGLGGAYEGHPTVSRGWVDGAPEPFTAIPIEVSDNPPGAGTSSVTPAATSRPPSNETVVSEIR